MDKQITTQNAQDVIQEIETAFFDIPFQNSQFQTKHFVLESQITPARSYRALGLRLHDRLSALISAKYSKLRADIDLEELEWKLKNTQLDQFERRRLELDIEESRQKLPFSQKLINDALAECEYLYSVFKKFPRYTREEFEAEEEKYFVEMSKRQVAGITGARESLMNITYDSKAFEEFFLEVQNGNYQAALDKMGNTLNLEHNTK